MKSETESHQSYLGRKKISFIITIGIWVLNMAISTTSYAQVSVTSINITPPSLIITSASGTSQTFITNVLPANATDKNVTWSVSPSNLGVISSNGIFSVGSITGIVTITATSISTPDIYANAIITINSINIPVSSISITPINTPVMYAETIQLDVQISPSNATNQNISFSSSPYYAQFEPNGKVTINYLYFDGLLTITASSISNPTLSTNTVLTVNPIDYPIYHQGSIVGGTTSGATLSYGSTVKVDGNYAYVATGYGIEILDISNPSFPIHFNFIDLGSSNSPSSISISNDYLYITYYNYITGGGLYIYDKRNPASPVQKGNLINGTGGALLNNPRNIYVTGDFAYITSAGDGFTSIGAGLEIINISNPSLPFHAGSFQSRGFGTVQVLGNYAYVGDGNLSIFDVSNPYAPVQIPLSITGTAIDGKFYISGNYAYFITLNYHYDDKQGMVIVDISNPLSLVKKGSVLFNNGKLSFGRDIKVIGNYAYVVGDAPSAIEIIDVSDADTPKYMGYLKDGKDGALLYQPKSVDVSGDYAYIVGDANALEIVKFTKPSSQSIIGFNPFATQTLGNAPLTLSGISATSNLPISLTSSNLSVATVSGNIVTFLSGGVTTITAIQQGNPFYKSAPSVSQILTVQIRLDSISIYSPITSIGFNQQTQLSTTSYPNNATDPNVTWSTFPSNMGFMQSDGTFIAGTIPGVVTITAISIGNPSISSHKVVTIISDITPVSGISISPSISTIAGGDSQLFSANVSPSNATNKRVHWSTSPEGMGYFRTDGTFFAYNTISGIVTITATSIDNSSISSYQVFTIVSNYIPVSGISISPSINTITGGDSQLFSANVSPSNATNKSYTGVHLLKE